MVLKDTQYAGRLIAMANHAKARRLNGKERLYRTAAHTLLIPTVLTTARQRAKARSIARKI